MSCRGLSEIAEKIKGLHYACDLHVLKRVTMGAKTLRHRSRAGGALVYRAVQGSKQENKSKIEEMDGHSRVADYNVIGILRVISFTECQHGVERCRWSVFTSTP